MKKTSFLLGITAALILAFTIEKIVSASKNKIGVVQMNTLVYEFMGMKAATQRYDQKVKEWSATADTLEQRVVQLEKKLGTMQPDQRKWKPDDQATYIHARQNYQEYMKKLEKQAQEEDQQLTSGVLTQLNTFIGLYAEAEGYDVILCNNDEKAGMGHFDKKLDITNDVLAFANLKYNSVN